MGARQPNKNTVLATNQKLLAGVDKHFAKVKNMTIAGVTYTPAELKALFQSETDALTTLDQGKAQLKEQVATTRAASAKASVTRQGLRTYILGNYGPQAVQTLEDFGMSAPKPMGRRSVKTKAQALVQAEATREARHTMGSKQRLTIKGVVPAPVAAPQPEEAVTPPPAPVATSAAAVTPSHS